MKIVRTLATDCPNGIDCSKVQELADRNLLVRGYAVDATAKHRHALPVGLDVVRVPGSVYQDAHPEVGDRLDPAVLEVLPDGSRLVAGTVLAGADRQALALPDGEDAVVILETVDEEAALC